LRAAVALREIGSAAKAAVPALADALKEDDWDLRQRAAQALSRMRPAAKTAIPALIEALQVSADAIAKQPPAKETELPMPRKTLETIAWVLAHIDPEIRPILPPPGPGSEDPPGILNPRPRFSTDPALWQKAIDALKKKYAGEK